MSRHLLDSSFVIDLFNEIADGCDGPAHRWLRAHPRTELWISPVTYAEVLEGADDMEAVRAALARFRWQGIGRAHAERVALGQARCAQRRGENDAWQVAVAELMDAVLVGHDRKAFGRMGSSYEDHRES